MKAKLAVAALIAALSQTPAISHAQMGMESTAEFQWDVIGPGRYALRGHDVVVRPEQGRYVVYKDGMKDKDYTSLSDARMRGEHLAMQKPVMREKMAMPRHNPSSKMPKEMPND